MVDSTGGIYLYSACGGPAWLAQGVEDDSVATSRVPRSNAIWKRYTARHEASSVSAGTGHMPPGRLPPG